MPVWAKRICHRETAKLKTHDPVLKLYDGRPLLIINEILIVKKCIANGTICEFQSIVLKEKKETF